MAVSGSTSTTTIPHGSTSGYSIVELLVISIFCWTLFTVPWWSGTLWQRLRSKLHIDRLDEWLNPWFEDVATAKGPSGTHQQVRIYLCFLESYCNLFCLLTVVSMFIIVPIWGIEYYMIFLPMGGGFLVGISDDMAQAGLDGPVCICSLTVAIALISFLYVVNFQQSTTIQSEHNEQRALWLSNLPTRDQATLQEHHMGLRDLEEVVASDLRMALDRHLQGKRSSKIGNESAGGHGACPLGECPCDCICCGCTLACTLVVKCCHRCQKPPKTVQREPQQPPTADVVASVIGDTWKRQSRLGHFSAALPYTGSKDGSESKEGMGSQRPSFQFNGDRSDGEQNYVENISVQPVMLPYSEHIKLYKRFKDAEERAHAYEKRIQVQPDFLQPTGGERWLCGVELVWCRFQCLRWCRYRYHQRKHRHWKAKSSSLKSKLMETKADQPVTMSGHAFVVFDNLNHVDVMLEPRRKWYETRHYTPFRFGRPPFSSVTLQCREAPHPSDMRWDNCHVKFCPMYFFHMLHLVLLFGTTFLVVGVIALASRIEGLDDCLHEDSTLSIRATSLCWAYRTTHLGESPMLEQLPPLALIVWNSLVVPYWIERISELRRYLCYSWGEVFQLNLNLFLLVMSKFVVPLVTMFTAAIAGAYANSGKDSVDSDMLETVFSSPVDVIGNAGVFYIRYALYCAFLSNGCSLLQLGRHFLRVVMLSFYTVTESEKREANACSKFAWGYWYAWSLSLAINGLVMGIVVPSMLPATALNFCLKHYADRKLFEEKTFDLGPERVAHYSPRVAHFMYGSIALMLVSMGLGVLVYTFLNWEKFTDDYSPYVAGLGLVVLAIALWTFSGVMKLHILLNEQISDPGDLFLRDCWLRIMKLLQFVGCKMELANNAAQPSSARTLEDPLINSSVTWDARTNMLTEALTEEKDPELRRILADLFGKLEDPAGGFVNKKYQRHRPDSYEDPSSSRYIRQTSDGFASVSPDVLSPRLSPHRPDAVLQGEIQQSSGFLEVPTSGIATSGLPTPSSRSEGSESADTTPDKHSTPDRSPMSPVRQEPSDFDGEGGNPATGTATSATLEIIRIALPSVQESEMEDQLSSSSATETKREDGSLHATAFGEAADLQVENEQRERDAKEQQHAEERRKAEEEEAQRRKEEEAAEAARLAAIEKIQQAESEQRERDAKEQQHAEERRTEEEEEAQRRKEEEEAAEAEKAAAIEKIQQAIQESEEAARRDVEEKARQEEAAEKAREEAEAERQREEFARAAEERAELEEAARRDAEEKARQEAEAARQQAAAEERARQEIADAERQQAAAEEEEEKVARQREAAAREADEKTANQRKEAERSDAQAKDTADSQAHSAISVVHAADLGGGGVPENCISEAAAACPSSTDQPEDDTHQCHLLRGSSS